MQRRTRMVLAVGLGLPFLGCAGLMTSIFSSFPTYQGDLVDAGDFVGVGGDSYGWIVPVQGGVVWVDAGLDPEAADLLAHSRGPVLAVLITHGHADHTVGLQALRDVPVYTGPTEGALVTGERRAGSWMAGTFGALMGNAGPTPQLREVKDGDVITVGGQQFEAVHVPGHTTGSLVWVWQDVAFTGDSLLGHTDHLAPVHWAFATDHAQNLRSVKKLVGRGIQRVADGHAGLHTDVGDQVDAL
ncbi:MAG: MBL fold metallo-hydrolase [Myxococcales bacterium]|nr:MBL fold metallo-hydrolase [Myxococcales bacterium]